MFPNEQHLISRTRSVLLFLEDFFTLKED